MKPVLTHLAAAMMGGALVLLATKREERESPENRSSASSPSKSGRVDQLAARRHEKEVSLDMSGPAEPVSDGPTTEPFKHMKELGVIQPSRDALMDYIASRNHDPEALFAAGLILGDIDLLREAAESDHTRPHFAFALAARNEVPSEERIAMAKHLLELAPDNAMASGLLAFCHFEAGDSEAGLAALRQVAGQVSFDDFARERVLATEEAMRAIGSTAEGARLYAVWMLSSPHLFNLLQIAPHLRLNDPDLPAAERDDRRNLLGHIGANLAAAPPGNNLFTEAMGLAIQQRAHEGLPDDAPSAFEGVTVAEARAGIVQRRNELRANQGPDESQLLALPTEIRSSYLNRAFLLGEYEANVWLRQQPEFASQLPSAK